ncbi:TetR/AcrR family transcriptional regulator [Nocardia transvalensis]|uniref:TetR/AcrR family transcriptional regulator n=1 Tax=Nocardia transvalensis TaxID=37333 RepID=UPI001894ED70|nr:TetR/AcrR family transcriptional regulator [Nocardia transvalensis]MBF6333112.1 TetR/AcrR family transcriptional regulator [Nocardia transvalensis]
MTTAEQFRERILDAAYECYLEAPLSERMHTLIAERAGVSRPTVYKYVGDQEEIRRALMLREAMRYIAALEPVFARRLPLREHFRELIVFTVVYLRDNALFKVMLDAAPEVVARGLTVDLAPLLALGSSVAEPMLMRLHPEMGEPRVPLHMVIEWGVRISLSLLTTPSPYAELTRPEAIRAHVDALFAIIEPPTVA